MKKSTKFISILLLCLIVYFVGFYYGIQQIQRQYDFPKYTPTFETIQIVKDDPTEIKLEQIINFNEGVYFDEYSFENLERSEYGVHEGRLILTVKQISVVVPFSYEVIE